MSQFQWETDDETHWDNGVDQVPTPRQERGRQLTALLILILLVAGGTAGYRHIKQQMQEAEAQVEVEIWESYQLLQEAVATGDAELTAIFLPIFPKDWVTVQSELFRDGIVAERPGWGLQLLPSLEKPELELELDSDLRRAEVQIPHQYVWQSPAAVAETVTFKQTRLYEKQFDQWILQPEDELFWGKSHQVKTEWITLEYFERDRELSNGFAAFMQLKFQEICAVDQLLCARLELASPKLNIVFITSPDPFAARIDAGRINNAIYLPTPTIFGLPQGESERGALYRIYAYSVFSELLNTRQGVYEQLKLQEQLSAFDLIFSPVTLPTEPLGQDLLLFCDRNDDGPELYRWLADSMRWDAVLQSLQIEQMALNELDNQLVMQQADTLSFWYDGGSSQLLDFSQLMQLPEAYENNFLPDLEWAAYDKGERLFVYYNGFEEYLVMDVMDGCENNRCVLSNGNGQPRALSPDGRHYFVQYGENQLTLIVTTGGFSEQVKGHTPVWLDLEQYLYIERTQSNTQIKLRQQQSLISETLLSNADLLPLLGADRQADQLFLLDMIQSPNNSSELLLVSATVVDRVSLSGYQLFWFDQQRGEVNLLLDQPQVYSFLLSPDGRHAGFSYYSMQEKQWVVQLADTIIGDVRDYRFLDVDRLGQPPSHDWSLDGRWLGRIENGVVQLLDLDSQRPYQLLPPVAGCNEIAWFDKTFQFEDSR